jgi:hypothetical protein
MKPPKCSICESEHFGAVHVWKKEIPKPSSLCAINTTAINKIAINSEPKDKLAVNPSNGGRVQVRQQGVQETRKAPRKADEGRTPNRRDRSAYNAYMRVKMREYRAKKTA